MTENEAIQGFKMDNVLLGDNEKGTVERNNIAIQALEEIQQYRANGTADECRTAVERMKPKKATDAIYFGEAGYYIGLCPSCNDVNNSEYQYCGNCGQAIDWSKENE